jgi:hypothetical protein
MSSVDHALRDVQRMMDRRQHHTDAETDPAGALADRCQCQVGGAVMRPHRAEVMLGKPDAGEALLLGIGDLLEGFVDALRFTGGRPGFWHLDLIEQANAHRIVSRLAVEPVSPSPGLSVSGAIIGAPRRYGFKPKPGTADLRPE